MKWVVMPFLRRKRHSLTADELSRLFAANATANPAQFEDTLQMVSSLAQMKALLSAVAAIRAVAICESPDALEAYSAFDTDCAEELVTYTLFVHSNFDGYSREAIGEYQRHDTSAAQALLAAVNKYDPRVVAESDPDGVKTIEIAVRSYMKAHPLAMEDFERALAFGT